MNTERVVHSIVEKKTKILKIKRPKLKIYRNRVAEVMEQKKIINQELADLIPTNPGHVTRILSNERPCISLPIALRIAEILETPVEELFILKEPKKTRTTRK